MAVPLKKIMPSPTAMKARMAVIEALKTFGDDLEPLEQLAIVAYLVGQLIAVQDQRKITPAMAMEIVAANIEDGNAQAIAALIPEPEGNG